MKHYCDDVEFPFLHFIPKIPGLVIRQLSWQKKGHAPASGHAHLSHNQSIL